MPMVFWFFVVVAVFAISDIIGIKTKAFLSSTFVMLLVFLVLFMTKLIPPDVIAQSGFRDIALIASYIVFIDMGTIIDVPRLKAQWKVCVIAVFSMVTTIVGILCVMPIIGRESALVSIPVINGAMSATVIIVRAASEKGLVMAAALGTLIYGLQKFVGTPPVSYCGRTVAKALVEDYRKNLQNGIDLLTDEPTIGQDGKVKSVRKPLYERFDRYLTAPVLLSIVGLLAYAANVIAAATGLGYSVWCMVLGFLVRLIGIVPERPLTKANSNGLLLVATFGTIVPSLAEIKFEDLGVLGMQLVWVFGASLLSMYLLICVLPAWKILGSRHLAFGVAACQLFGFPATMIISKEIALGYSENEREREYIERNLMVPYVVGGLVSVAILSPIVAGVLANFL